MKKSISTTVGLLTILTSATVAAQNVQSVNQLRSGVLYNLTPGVARSLNLDFGKIQNELKPRSTEKILFKISENGELDLSIYENSVFKEARADDELK